MKKINLFLIFFMAAIVAVSGYLIFFNSPTYNYQKYNTRKSELLSASAYSPYTDYFQLQANTTALSSGQYSIVVTIDQVVERMDNVEIILISGSEKILETDTLYPSKNILYTDVFHLIPTSSAASGNEKHGINLNFVSENPVTSVYLYIGFKLGQNFKTLYIHKAIT